MYVQYSTVCVSLIMPSRLISQLNVNQYLRPSPCPSLSLLSTVSFFLFLFLLVLLPSLSLTTYNLLPVVLSSSEPDRASYLAKRTLSTIYRGCPTEFQPSMALDFFPKLLTHLSLRYCMVCVRVCVHYVCVCVCIYLYVCVCVCVCHCLVATFSVYPSPPSTLNCTASSQSPGTLLLCVSCGLTATCIGSSSTSSKPTRSWCSLQRRK